jgi:hypothetical protein
MERAHSAVDFVKLAASRVFCRSGPSSGGGKSADSNSNSNSKGATAIRNSSTGDAGIGGGGGGGGSFFPYPLPSLPLPVFIMTNAKDAAYKHALATALQSLECVSTVVWESELPELKPLQLEYNDNFLMYLVSKAIADHARLVAYKKLNLST